MTSFSKNVLKLSVGNVIAQVISLAAMPLITRMYSPESYGIFAIYLSVTMFLFPVSSLHFDRAINLPKDNGDAANLLALSLLSVAVFSISLAIMITVLKYTIFLPKALLLKGLIDYLWLVPIAVFIQGNLAVVMPWALRKKMFGNMANARITASINSRAFTLAAGYFSRAGVFGLIGGRIAGPFIALCYLMHRTIIREQKTIRSSLSFAAMKKWAFRYKGFCTFSILSEFVINAAREAPLILLAFFFSPLLTGYYALAMRVVNLPMKLIGEALSKVFLQRTAEAYSKGKSLLKDTTNLFGYLIYFTAPPVLIILCIGKELFTIIFGPEWEVAGTYSQIMVLSFLGMFLYQPLSSLFYVFERQKQKLVISCFLFLARAGSILVSGYLFNNSIQSTLLILAATTCVVYIGAYIYLFSLVGLNAFSVLKILSNKTALMLPIIAGSLLSRYFMGSHNVMAAFVLIASIILQGIIITLNEPQLKQRYSKSFHNNIVSLCSILFKRSFK